MYLCRASFLGTLNLFPHFRNQKLKIMSNKKKILVIQKVHNKGMELINNHPNFDVEVTDDVSVENLKTKIKDCDGASIRIAKLPGEVINEAKNLKIISRHGVGYDNIDLKTAKEKNIKIAILKTLSLSNNSNKKSFFLNYHE